MVKDKYCHKCGTLLQKTLISLENFDPDTGEEKFKLHYKCPNKKKKLFDSHDSYDDSFGLYWDEGSTTILRVYDKDGNLIRD